MQRYNLLVVLLFVCISSSIGALPSPVRNLELSGVYAYDAFVYWNEPLDWGEPYYGRHNSFYVSKLYFGNELIKRTEFGAATFTERALSDLSINSTYTFSIAVKNVEGEGPFTNVTFTTAEYWYPSKVRDFRPATYGTSFAIFTWDEPQNDGNYPISNYSYFCEQLTNNGIGNWEVAGTVPASNRFFTLNGLQQQYMYSCEVTAWNDMGESLSYDSNPFTFITLPGFVEKVENVTVNTITTNSAHIVWDVPSSTFELYFYVVSYYDKSTVTYMQQFVKDNQVTLSGLASATDYVVRVKAVDIYSSGGLSIIPYSATYGSEQNSDPISFTTPHYICPDD